MAQRLGVPFLGAIPINMLLRENSDSGDPTANFEAGGKLCEEIEAVVEQLDKQAALASMRKADRAPELTVG
jgi:hypothetical protein